MQIARFTEACWCVLVAALLPMACAWLAKSQGFGKPRHQGGFDNHDPRSAIWALALAVNIGILFSGYR